MNVKSKRKPFQYLIHDWMIETDQNPENVIDACFGDYVRWYFANYPTGLEGISRDTLEAWWDDEVGLNAGLEEFRKCA